MKYMFNNINNNNNNSNNNSNSFYYKIKNGFSLDKRSLAFFRVVFSIFLLIDLLTRCMNFKEHYTDEGVFPRSSSISSERFSLYQLSGSFEFTLFMFLIQALIYLSMMVGFKTHLSTALAFIFLCSIQNRNHFLIDGSDDYSRILLFWTIFLPTNRYFSVDLILKKQKQQQQQQQQQLNENENENQNQTTIKNQADDDDFINNKNNKVTSGSTISFILQFANIYIFTALFKTADTWHVDYSAVYYALNLIQFRHGLATFFLQFPSLMVFLTRGTLIFEYLGPLLIVSPWFNTTCRIISILGFISMHIGFGVCLNLYLFVFIPMVVCMAFIPSDVWDFIENKYINRKEIIKIHYNSNLSKSFQFFIEFFSTFFLVNQNYKIIKQQSNKNSNSNNNHIHDSSEYNEKEEEDSYSSIFYVDSISVYSNGQIYDQEAAIKILFKKSIFFSLFVGLISDKVFKMIFTYLYNTTNDDNNSHHINEKNYRLNKLNANNNQTYGDSNKSSNDSGRYKKIFKNLFFILLASYMLYYNFCIYTVMKDSGRNTDIMTPAFQPLARFIKIDQYWAMFAPSPPDFSFWIASDAKFSLINQVDIFTEKESQYKEIPSYFFHMGQRKRNFYLAVAYLDHLRLEFGRYQCRKWNLYEPKQEFGKLISFKIYSVFQDTPLPPSEKNNYITEAPEAPKLQLIWEHVC